MHYHDPTQLYTSVAPLPADLNWHNLTKTRRERMIRGSVLLIEGAVVYITLAIMFLVWNIPIAALSAVSNLDNLPWLEDLLGNNEASLPS